MASAGDVSFGTVLAKLRNSQHGLALYNAGLPGYARNFARDSLIAGLLMDDPVMLRDQLTFCATTQGSRKDAESCEEPGKIFHEIPPITIRNRKTTFNACDTTALFLLGHARHAQLTGDTSFLESQWNAIGRAVGYIVSHTREGLFVEDPAFADAPYFALKVSYWKDSVILDREAGEPKYPVVYTLAHTQNMHAIRKIAEVMGGPSALVAHLARMKEALGRLWDRKRSTFLIAKDALGDIGGVTSDSLHALFYLEPGDVGDAVIQMIVQSSKVLETAAGYRTMEPGSASRMSHGYHADTIWPFEQSMIAAGAAKFGLAEVGKIARRIVPYLSAGATEILRIKGNGFVPDGCDPQLWTLAAQRYFERNTGSGPPLKTVATH